MEEGFHRGFFSRPYGRSFFFYIFTCVMSTLVFFWSLLIYGYVLIVLFKKKFLDRGWCY